MLKTVMADGELLSGFPAALDDQVARAAESVAALPSCLRELGPARNYPVEFSQYLQRLQAETLKKVSV